MPLKKATLKQRAKMGKAPGQILVRRGVSGGLLGCDQLQGRLPTTVILSANKVYAAHSPFRRQKPGRGHQVLIPARSYMMVQDEDWAEITAAARDYLMEATR